MNKDVFLGIFLGVFSCCIIYILLDSCIYLSQKKQKKYFYFKIYEKLIFEDSKSILELIELNKIKIEEIPVNLRINNILIYKKFFKRIENKNQLKNIEKFLNKDFKIINNNKKLFEELINQIKTMKL